MTENDNSSKSAARNRILKAIVIALGVLIVLAFAALVIGAVMKLGHEKAAAVPAVAPAGAPFQSNLTLAPGQSVASAHLKGDRLLVRLKGPDSEEIVILDAATGRELGRIRAQPQP